MPTVDIWIRRLTALAAVMAVAAVPASAPAQPSSASAAKCTQAKIAGKRTCLAAGKACKPRYEKQYEKSGFQCRKSRGRYRLAKDRMAF